MEIFQKSLMLIYCLCCTVIEKTEVLYANILSEYGQDIDAFLANISNKDISRLLYEQLQHCQFTALCDLNTEQNPFITNMCCRPCNCLPNCGVLNNCCPDILTEEALLKPAYIPLHKTCVSSAVKRSYDHGVVGIDTCPSLKPGEERVPCENMDDGNPVFDNKLVTDLLTNTTFKNKNCALCNGIPKDRILGWQPRLQCASQEDYLKISNEQDTGTAINFIPECIIVYTLPFTPSERCPPTRDKCNITGLWKVKDEFLDWACASYVSPVMASDKKYYKNIFCAFCNGFTTILTYCDIESSSNPNAVQIEPFSALLQLNPVRTTQGTTCSPGYIELGQKGSCIKAHCSMIGELRGNVCEPKVTVVGAMNYVFSLRVFPSANMSIQEAFSIQYQVFRWFKENLLGSNHSHKMRVDHYKLFIVSRPGMLEELCLNTSIDFYDVSFELRYNNSHIPNDIRKLFIQNLHKKNVSITIEETTVKKFVSYVRHDSGDATRKVKLQGQGSEFFTGCLFVGYNYDSSPILFDVSTDHAWFDDVNGIYIVPLISMTVCDFESYYIRRGLLSVMSMNECPFITLSKANESWVTQSTGLWFPQRNKYLDTSQFMYSDHSTDIIYICASVYTNLHSTAGKSTISSHLILLISVKPNLLIFF